VRASLKINCTEIIKMFEDDNSVLILSVLISEKARPLKFKVTNLFVGESYHKLIFHGF